MNHCPCHAQSVSSKKHIMLHYAVVSKLIQIWQNVTTKTIRGQELCRSYCH